MARYVLGRFVGIFGVLFIVSIMIFLMIHFIPGGPFDAMPTTSEYREIPEHIRQKLLGQVRPRQTALCTVCTLHVGGAAG